MAMRNHNSSSISEDFVYHLFPSNPPVGFEHQDLHDLAFQYWQNFWSPLLLELDGTILSPADFFRQSWIGVLFERRAREHRIVGLHTATLFNLESLACTSHPYFTTSYENDFVPFLKERGARSLMSIEFLTIDKDFRRNQLKGTSREISFIHIMLGLAFNLAQREKVDVTAGVGRADLKADQRARDFGMTSRSIRSMHNVPVTTDFVLAENIRSCPLKNERKFISEVWSRSYAFEPHSNPLQEAA